MALCTFQGMMFNYATTLSAFWNCTLGIYVAVFIFSTSQLFVEYLPGRRFENVVQLLWLFTWVFDVVAFASTDEERPYIFQPLGEGAWCWIGPDFNVERFTLHYLYLFIAMGILAVLHIAIVIYLVSLCGKTIPKTVKKKIKIYAVGYPIIFMVVFMPLGTARVLGEMGLTISLEYIYVAICLFVSNGLINSIYYAITRDIFAKWRKEVTSKIKATTEPE